MGINAPSFYAAFGSKEQLFRDAVELYSQTTCAPMTRAFNRAPDARGAVEGLLRAATSAFRRPGKPRGCFVVLGATSCSEDNEEIADCLREQRAGRLEVIKGRLERGIADGELPASADPRGIATFYVTVLDGLAVEARDGASRKSMLATVDYAMAAWDTLAGAAA